MENDVGSEASVIMTGPADLWGDWFCCLETHHHHDVITFWLFCVCIHEDLKQRKQKFKCQSVRKVEEQLCGDEGGNINKEFPSGTRFKRILGEQIKREPSLDHVSVIFSGSNYFYFAV